MDTRQIYDRKQYIEQVRNSFKDSGIVRKNSYEMETGSGEREPKSYFKVRLAFSVLLFLGFLFVQQRNLSYEKINAAVIVKQIQKSVSLPESFSSLEKMIHFE